MPIIANPWFHRYLFLAERRKKKRHQDFLIQVMNHQKEFNEYHRNNRQKIIRSNRALIAYYRLKIYELNYAKNFPGLSYPGNGP